MTLQQILLQLIENENSNRDVPVVVQVKINNRLVQLPVKEILLGYDGTLPKDEQRVKEIIISCENNS